MKVNLKRPEVFFILALLGLHLVIYLLFNTHFFRVHAYLRAVLNYGLFTAVAILGYYGLGDVDHRWMKSLWLSLYLVIGSFRVICAFRYLLHEGNLNVLNTVLGAFNVFSGPWPFVFFILILKPLHERLACSKLS